MPTNPYSIVDYLKSTGQGTDFATRKRLAEQNGITGYQGTAQQNTSLLSLLSKPKASTPSQGTPVGTSTGVVGTGANDLYADPNDPLAGGASGRFLDLTNEEADKLGKLDEEAIGFGVPMSEVGDYYSDPAYKIPTLSYGESAGLSDEYGFTGIGNKNEFAGLTRAQAIAKAEAKKAGLQKEVSQNTSFGYNTDFLNASAGAKKLLDAYSIGLKSINSDAWKVPETKMNEANTLLENTLGGVSKLFGSATDFDKLYSQDPSFKATIDNFTKSGGSVDALKAKLPQPVAPKEDFTITSGNKETDKILAPQTDILKQNVDYLKSVPEQYKSLYFGDTGYFTKIRQEAEASIKALDDSYLTVQKDTLADYEIQRQKNEADATIQLAEIEENRATNKNYLNGMLAKLGALTTSGEAPVAIAKLDAKYDTLQTQTKTALTTAQSALSSAKTKAISELENNRLSKISAIKSDLSKSSFEIQKEIMGVENETRKEINAQIKDWQKEASRITQEAIKNANDYKLQYDKLYAKTASGGLLSSKTLAGLTKGQLSPNAQAVLANPALLQNFTPTERGKIITEITNAGQDTKGLTLNPINATGREQIDSYDTLTREAENVKYLLDKGIKTGLLDTLGQEAGAKLGGSQDYTNYRSSLDNLGSILIKARSGAAVTPQEFERIAGFIPGRYDDEKTAKTKVERFFSELALAKANYIKRQTQTTYDIANEKPVTPTNFQSGAIPVSDQATALRSKYNY